MAILDILTYPDKFLKKTTSPVTEIDEETTRIIKDMAETMYVAPGVGLAATQVGIDMSIIVIDPEAGKNGKNYQAFINPKILSHEGEYLSENEGCLSVPEFRADVKRAESVVMKALNHEGKPVTINAEGIYAVILQHEIDHLNGILFIDRISKLKREMYKRRVKKQMRKDG